MPFVKLDTGILNSTLWVERECREVFITSLLMASPVEFTEPQPQIEVNSLKYTGFSAPPGWYGFVEAAGVGIVRRAMVEQSAGLLALQKLGAVDPESRSKDFEGRRLIRIDGGYLVLNFMKYRDRDYTGAIRAQRYRDRKKAAEDSSKINSHKPESRRDIITSHRDITQAECRVQSTENTLAPTVLVERKALDPNAYRVPDCPYETILSAYHEALPMLPRVVVVNNARKASIRSRWTEVCATEKFNQDAGVQWFRDFLYGVKKSKFLTGNTNPGKDRRPFRADLEWLMKPGNFAKVVEGRYHGDIQ